MAYYLDERIVIRTFLGTPIPPAGIYKYSVTEYGWEGSNKVIFIGNLYFNQSLLYQSVDITDIIRSRKETKIESHLINKYKVQIYLTDSNVKSSDWVNVNMVYRYPNVKNGITDGSGVYPFVYDIVVSDDEDEPSIPYLVAPLQGTSLYDGTATVHLSPHYPLKDTTNYGITQKFINNDNLELYADTVIQIKRGGRVLSSQYLSVDYGMTSFIDLSLHSYWNNNMASATTDLDVYLSVDGDSMYYTMGILDKCYSHYYLLWQDRLGGYQSQPFDNATFSESFNVTETQNYKNERKKSFIQVQPKWKINSGWIAEDIYPFYESIFVSPTLKLYDAYEDACYDVIVNGSYTEKTYKNEKKMLNLSLDLEAISKQNIMY